MVVIGGPHLQSTEEKHEGDGELLMTTHVQLPNAPHWHAENAYISKEINDTDGKVELNAGQ
jgi:hypothetical protein